MGFWNHIGNVLKLARGGDVMWDWRRREWVETRPLDGQTSQSQATRTDANRVQERLDSVNALFAAGKISQEEAATARAAILRDLT